MPAEVTQSDALQQIKGMDLANFAIDRCPSAQAMRLSSLALLASPYVYILTGNIEDQAIARDIRSGIQSSVHLLFSSGKLADFSRSMLTQAKAALSSYERDYFYTLAQSAAQVVSLPAYQEFVTAYQALMADTSKEATIVKKHMHDIRVQASSIYTQQSENNLKGMAV